MKKPTKNNLLYWLLKGVGIIISALLPIWVVFEKFPLWAETHGTGKTIGMGGLIGATILIVIFRKTVIGYLKEKLNLNHTPPLMMWIVSLIVTYTLIYIIKFLYDLALVLWMGLLGSVIGTLFTFAAEILFGNEREKVEDKTEEKAVEKTEVTINE